MGTETDSAVSDESDYLFHDELEHLAASGDDPAQQILTNGRHEPKPKPQQNKKHQTTRG